MTKNEKQPVRILFHKQALQVKAGLISKNLSALLPFEKGWNHKRFERQL